MDFNYEDYAEEVGLSQEEQDNYYNMKEELQRQINAVIEENQLLRKGNEELMVALEELRQKKNDILQIYRSTVRRAERLAAAAKESEPQENRYQYLPLPVRSRFLRYNRYGNLERRSGKDEDSAGPGPSRPASSSSYLSPALYSPSSCSSPNSFSPYSQEGIYLRAMEYARFSSSNPKYNRSCHIHGGQSCRFCYSHHH